VSFGENGPDFIFEAIVIRNRHKPFESYGRGGAAARNATESYIETIERRSRHQPDNSAFGFLTNSKQMVKLVVHCFVMLTKEASSSNYGYDSRRINTLLMEMLSFVSMTQSK